MRIIHGWMKIVCISILAFYYSTSYAYQYESMDKLRNIAKDFLLSNIPIESDETINVAVNPPQSTIHVPLCAANVVAAFPTNTNRDQTTNIELTCNDTRPWHIYLPVDVQITTNVIVAKRTMAANEMIMDNDIDYAPANKNRLYSGFFKEKQDVIGDTTKQMIVAGTILTKKNVQLPILVHRDQTVSIIAQSNSVIVTMQGIAKSDGALNSLVKVFNPASKKMLDAIVVGPNKAQVVA